MDAYACQRCMVILPKPLAVTKQMSDHSFGAYILEGRGRAAQLSASPSNEECSKQKSQ